jgi:serine/threonine protein kinase
LEIISLGFGGFGEVFKGTYKGVISVAVKKLKITSQADLNKIYESFKRELEILV